MLSAFPVGLSQLEALLGGRGVCNGSHRSIRSTVFNLDNLAAWQRRKLQPWGWRNVCLFGFPHGKAIRLSGCQGAPCPSPTPSTLCRLGLPKLPEILTWEVRGGSQVTPMQVTGSETYLRSCDEEVGKAEVSNKCPSAPAQGQALS